MGGATRVMWTRARQGGETCEGADGGRGDEHAAKYHMGGGLAEAQKAARVEEMAGATAAATYKGAFKHGEITITKAGYVRNTTPIRSTDFTAGYGDGTGLRCTSLGFWSFSFQSPLSQLSLSGVFRHHSQPPFSQSQRPAASNRANPRGTHRGPSTTQGLQPGSPPLHRHLSIKQTCPT